MSKRFHVAIVGATGAAGREILALLEERSFPVDRVSLFASPRAEGEKVEFLGEEHTVRTLTAERLAGVQLALVATPATVAREWIPMATKAGALVVDCSGAFSAEADVPLVIPEVNADAMQGPPARGIVASPGGPTVELATVLAPLHAAATLLRVVVSTYQPVSGRGRKGIAELEKQTSDLMNGREVEATVFPQRIAFNLVPQVGEFLESGSTKGEQALVEETRKVLRIPDLRVSATEVQVPVFFGLGQSVNLTTEKKLGAAEARELLRKAPGLKVLDEPAAGVYPMPMLSAGDDTVHVGRIRDDRSQVTGLDLFVASDDVRRGALNAVQIAERLAQ